MGVVAANTLGLAAKTSADQILTCDPEMTFFKCRFARHTNFQTGQIDQCLGSGASSAVLIGAGDSAPRRICTTIQRTSDLIGPMYVRTVLPALNTVAITGRPGRPASTADIAAGAYGAGLPTSTVEAEFAAGEGYCYVDEVAHFMVNRAEFQIGGHRMDELHDVQQYLEWHRDQTSETKMEYSLGMGDDQTRIDRAYREQVTYSPLRFWFTKAACMYLPVIAMQGHEAILNIDGVSARSMYGGVGTTAGGGVVAPQEFDAAIDARIVAAIHNATQDMVYDGVFLDRAERMHLAKSQLEYTMTEHQDSTNLGLSEGSANIRLTSLAFNHPSRDIMFALRRRSCVVGVQNGIEPDLIYPVKDGGVGEFKTPQQWNNFSGGIVLASNERSHALDGLQLKINNYDRLYDVQNVGAYYQEVHPSQKFVGQTYETFGHYYCFGQNGMGPKPSGSLNFSAIDNVDALITRRANPASTYTDGGPTWLGGQTDYPPVAFEQVDVFIYVCSINVLKFVSGMGGKAYAN